MLTACLLDFPFVGRGYVLWLFGLEKCDKQVSVCAVHYKLAVEVSKVRFRYGTIQRTLLISQVP